MKLTVYLFQKHTKSVKVIGGNPRDCLIALYEMREVMMFFFYLEEQQIFLYKPVAKMGILRWVYSIMKDAISFVQSDCHQLSTAERR